MADVNGNGAVDYVMVGPNVTWFATNGTRATVILGTSGCTISSTRSTSNLGIDDVILDIAVGDVTGDSKADVVLLTANKLWVATGNNNGTFNTATSTTVASNQQYLLLVNADGDGDLDAVVVDQPDDESPANVVLYTNNGSGTWSQSTAYTANPDPTNIVAADTDENGTPDFIVGSTSANTITVIRR